MGEQVECFNYDTWGVCLPEGDFPATVGDEPFRNDLRMLFPGARGDAAVAEWQKLQTFMTPLAAASVVESTGEVGWASVEASVEGLSDAFCGVATGVQPVRNAMSRQQGMDRWGMVSLAW